MAHIKEVTGSEDLRKAQVLLRAFPQHQRAYYAADLDTVLRYFDLPEYEKEVSDLHAHYPPPRACVLIASEGEEAVGVVCLRPVDAVTCEMKRLYVPATYRRKGIGQALCMALMDAARQRGFTTMRLDTAAFMTGPQVLYRKLGFTYTSPDPAVRKDLRDQLVFMQLHL